MTFEAVNASRLSGVRHEIKNAQRAKIELAQVRTLCDLSGVMKTIAIYLTRSGKIAAQVFQHGPQSFSYIGTIGAGCETSLASIARTIKTAMRTRKGIRFSSGTDVTL